VSLDAFREVFEKPSEKLENNTHENDKIKHKKKHHLEQLKACN
jgi:hypothetical protein